MRAASLSSAWVSNTRFESINHFRTGIRSRLRLPGRFSFFSFSFLLFFLFSLTLRLRLSSLNLVVNLVIYFFIIYLSIYSFVYPNSHTHLYILIYSFIYLTISMPIIFQDRGCNKPFYSFVFFCSFSTSLDPPLPRFRLPRP